MSLLAPLALLFSLFSVPIILMYMLRLRRTEHMVSSTFLWRQLVQDREANAPWQRLRFSWLLLLQLLILLALVLALARPALEVRTVSSGRIVLLLDASASMNATDGRFGDAQQEALEIVNSMGGDDTMTLIRVTDVPEVLLSASRDKAALRDAIRDAQPSETGADWVAALTLAAAGARGVEELEVVLVGDGGLPGNLPEIPGDIRYVPVGSEGENVAITALATRATPGEGPQLFASVTNYGLEATETIFSLSLDGELFNSQRYEIAPESTVSIIVEDLPETFREIYAYLVPPSDAPTDYLPTDDAAYAIYHPGGAGRVLLMTPRNIFLEQLFGSLPGVELTTADPATGLPDGEYDLIVLDGWVPDNLPDTDLFMINPTSGRGLFSVTGVIEDRAQSVVTAVAEEDPRTQFVDFGDVDVRAFRQLAGYEEWATELIMAEGGALLIAGETEGRQVAVLSFALQDSNLPLQLAWPILVSNLTQWYTPPRLVEVADSVPPSTALNLQTTEGESVRVTLPDGQTRDLPLRESGSVIFADTTQNGIYQVEARADNRTLSRDSFAVNLFSPQESIITPRANVIIGTRAISETAREEVGQRELWPYLALLGLLILLLEWMYYHRGALRRTQPTFTPYRGAPTKKRRGLANPFRRA